MIRAAVRLVGREVCAVGVALLFALAVVLLPSTAWADACDTTDPLSVEGCGTEERPYVVKPKGETGLLVRPEPGQSFVVEPKTGTVTQVEVTNWPSVEPTEPTTVVELTDAQYAVLLAGLGVLVFLAMVHVVSGFGRGRRA